MTVEVNPVGIRCGAKNGGLDCLYCYERHQRLAEGDTPLPRVDIERIKAIVSATGGNAFSLHGGEALLARAEDLETLWAWGLETYGHNGLQTSGRPITEEHLRLFEKYKVHVGFSVDGPGELNLARRAGTNAETLQAAAHSDRMLRRCLRLRRGGASLIVTLHKINASPARLPKLVSWLRSLAHAGLRDARLHVLQSQPGTPGRSLILPVHEQIAAMRACRDLEEELDRKRWLWWRRAPLQFDVFKDIRRLLLGKDNDVTCIWNGCNLWSTSALFGVNADGSRHGCGRSEEDSKWLPVERCGVNSRPLLLMETPQEEGGCMGCRHFVVCKGQCPGMCIDDDWRMRSVDCELWRTLIEDEEARIVARGGEPVTLRKDLRQIEEAMRATWARNKTATISAALRSIGCAPSGRPGTRPHIDHWDSARRGEER